MIGGLPLFGDDRELQLGTDPGLARAVTIVENDEAVDPYPLDTDDDAFVDTADLASITARFNQAQSPANIRYDLKLSGFIDTGDIGVIANGFGQGCPPPP